MVVMRVAVIYFLSNSLGSSTVVDA
jgi:hypothetical protein